MRITSRIYDADIPYSVITNLCYEAVFHKFEAVQVFPNMVELCRHVLGDSGVEVRALIAYPHGTFTAEQKAEEIRDAVSLGADQLEVCLNCLNVRSGQWELVRQEMRACKAAAAGKKVLFILEVEYLTDEQITRCCAIALEEGLSGLVTSTGLYNTVDANLRDVSIVATEKDVRLIKEAVGDKLDVVAQGFIRTPQQAQALLAAGADVIASEKAVHVIGAAWEGDVVNV